MRGNPRVHAIDLGLVSAFSLAPAPLDDPRTRGLLVETAAFRHLHELEWKCQGQLRFYQERGGGRARSEIDFVLIARDEVFALEITSAEGGVPSKASYVRSQLEAWNSNPERDGFGGDRLAHVLALRLFDRISGVGTVPFHDEERGRFVFP